MNQIAKTETETSQLTDHQDPFITMIERVLLSDLPIERVGVAMDLQERQMNKAAEQEFNRAFASAMADMPKIPRTGKGHNSTYSTLDDIVSTSRPILSKHGLALNWLTSSSDDGKTITVTAVLRHALGYKIENARSAAPDSGQSRNAIQSGGSTETYLKRYTAMSILGLSSGDEVEDDGRSANVELINADQYRDLAELIEKKGVNEEAFLKFFKCEALHELPLSLFARAKKALEDKPDVTTEPETSENGTA